MMMPVRRPTLIVSAWEPELAWLRRWLATPAGRAVTRGVKLAAVGVGAVDAGIAAAGLLRDVRPARLLFVGTAGVYGGARSGAPAIDDAVVVDRAHLISTATLRQESYAPAPLITEVLCDAALVRRLARSSGDDATPVGAACPLAITRAPALARRIARACRAGVENLELFSVGRAAALAGVPFAAVVGIANRVGPTAHAEWKAHHRSASRAAGQRVRAFLLTG
jgi:purine-nucleoside phosphorylase